jgi:hypothetical protein
MFRTNFFAVVCNPFEKIILVKESILKNLFEIITCVHYVYKTFVLSRSCVSVINQHFPSPLVGISFAFAFISKKLI